MATDSLTKITTVEVEVTPFMSKASYSPLTLCIQVNSTVKNNIDISVIYRPCGKSHDDDIKPLTLGDNTVMVRKVLNSK